MSNEILQEIISTQPTKMTDCAYLACMLMQHEFGATHVYKPDKTAKGPRGYNRINIIKA